MAGPTTAQKETSHILVFDRVRVRENRNRAARTIDSGNHNFLHNHALTVMIDRLHDVKRDFQSVLQIGAGSSPRIISGAVKTGKIAPPTVADCAPGFLTRYDTCETITVESDILPLPAGHYDLILSPLDLHTINDLPGALIQIRRALKPDGLFLGAMLGGETLHELRGCLQDAEITARNGISPRIAPFADKPQMGGLLQRAGFALPVVDSEIVTATYTDAFALMRELRAMGDGNAIADRDKRNPGKAMMMETARLYAERFAESGGRIRASFEIIYLIGWAPHESQQKPLRPGSAQTRLADALSTKEIGAGENAAPISKEK